MSKQTIQMLILAVAVIATLYSSPAIAQPPGGGPDAADMKLVKKFDKDANGILNADERAEARSYIEKEMSGRSRRGPRGRGRSEPGRPGPNVKPADVKNYPNASLYDTKVLRTIFLEFENKDWEKELEVFKPTDVEVPAKMTVDGKTYPDVGVSFRGASSFFMIPAGLKRSFNLTMDYANKSQRLYGHKSLNLLNANGDASMMSSALYSQIAGKKIPTPKVNFVKVVVNGESWGIYVSSQQFNKTFVKEHFKTSKGARWKVSGSPRGDGGLRYLGDEIEPYRQRFEIKSKDDEQSWKALINLCKVLNETPADQLEKALEPILDVDGALWFLAVDIALLNSDGYWTRASDYNIYLDPTGKFHILCHDMNEAFKMRHGRGGPPGRRGGRGGFGGLFGPPPEGPPPEGPPPEGPPQGDGDAGPPQRGGQGGPPQGRGGPPGGGFGGGGPTLDPLTGLNNDRMPLRSKLLSHPKLQQQYLQHIETVANLIKWENLGPLVAEMREQIEDEVAADTPKLSTTDAFLDATSPEKPAENSSSLRAFSEKRSKYLLEYVKPKASADK